MIFNPLEEYETKFKDLHAQNTRLYFDKLVDEAGVDIEKNRQTVNLYNLYKENLSKLRRKLNWFRFLRVLMCITIVLIPVVILKTTPKIKALRVEISEADQKIEALLQEAYSQMLPLNNLFTDRDALDLIQATIPFITFDLNFSAHQEADMKINYDFCEYNEDSQSTIDVLAGHYNENPFLFENKIVCTMGTEIYHGYKTIHWTETYRDSNGKLRTRTRSQTLHATVTKPKPFYNTQVLLSYCAQGGPELCFSRDASHMDRKSEREIERVIRRGEKKLKRKMETAVKNNDDFTSMSNSDFEVLFDALDRTDEIQFRTLFTPLAQTNMVSLLLSKTGFGDDFHFVKNNRTNRIVSAHSQNRVINLLPSHYVSYSFDIIKDCFINKNAEYFKAVYFDLAPILAIPIYQERPVHSLKPIPHNSQMYALKECEALANVLQPNLVVHPNTKTQAILKSVFVSSENGVDETCITAYSYDIAKRVDFVTVFGQDGRHHQVPVEWDEYLPLQAQNHFFVVSESGAHNKNVLADRNGLCIYKH